MHETCLPSLRSNCSLQSKKTLLQVVFILLEYPENEENFLKMTGKGDESWIYGYDLRTSSLLKKIEDSFQVNFLCHKKCDELRPYKFWFNRGKV
ncbi:hypothetical protein AVEN_243759-1 [Araneus ventricosus]|uniref:Uncharacterized protein n=1 Tax=Araneus ventricosus TaxID=182803 RepID=A0A4Y2A690_ARAVE|nr:hypothetical protein AVEN_243759-1 [Araneus ventricosus]